MIFKVSKKMPQKKSLAKNAVLNTAKTVCGIVFPIITYPYVSRVLGVDNMGIYTFSSYFLSYFLLIAALGVSTYGIREGTRYREDKNTLQLFVSELFSINMLSTVIAYILLFILLFCIPSLNDYKTVIIILSAEIVFTTIGVSWVCNVFEDFLSIAIRTIVMQIVSLVLIFVFVRSSADLNKYAVILLVSNSGANIINFFYIQKKYCKFRFTFKINWKRHFKQILIIFSTSVAITVYVSSDTTMLGFMTDNYQVGLYGTAVKIYTIIKNILAAILMVLIPRFTILFSKEDRANTDELFSKVFNILSVIMLPMCIGLFMLSPDVVTIVSGKEYIGASASLRLLSIAIAFSLYSYMYAQCVLIPVRQEKVVFKATLVSAIVNIVLNFVLIPFWGINAAAITTIIAELITFVICYYYSRSIVVLTNIKRNLISVFLGMIGIFFVCYFAGRIDHLILRISISIIGSVVIYVIILFIVKNPVLLYIGSMLRKKIDLSK